MSKASFADPFVTVHLSIMLVFVMQSCLFLDALCSSAGRSWPLACGVFLCFVAFPCGVPSRMWCLFVSVLYFE